MPTLVELTAEIVSSHARSSQMSSEELVQELQKVHAALKSLESGIPSEVLTSIPVQPALTVRQAFKKDEVICMVCGKGGFKTLKKHLWIAHQLKPGQYRKQFGIPAKQALAAKSYSESRRVSANERGLADVLAKARGAKVTKVAVKTPTESVDYKKMESRLKSINKNVAGIVVSKDATGKDKVAILKKPKGTK